MERIAKNAEEAASFLTRLKFKTATHEFEDMEQLCIDCCRYSFDRPLTYQQQYGLLEYAETLNLSRVWSIVLIAVWLYQHDIGFKMRFRWSRTRPIRYNLVYMPLPRRIQRGLKRRMDIVLSYDLADMDFENNQTDRRVS